MSDKENDIDEVLPIPTTPLKGESKTSRIPIKVVSTSCG